MGNTTGCLECNNKKPSNSNQNKKVPQYRSGTISKQKDVKVEVLAPLPKPKEEIKLEVPSPDSIRDKDTEMSATIVQNYTALEKKETMKLPLSGWFGKKYITETFNTDIDELFQKHDIKDEGMMDLEQVKVFLEDLQQHVSPELAGNYKNADIDALFDK